MEKCIAALDHAQWWHGPDYRTRWGINGITTVIVATS
jgi:hypothetical protein